MLECGSFAFITQKPVLKNRKSYVKIPKYKSLMLILFTMFLSRALIGQMMRDFVICMKKTSKARNLCMTSQFAYLIETISRNITVTFVSNVFRSVMR